MTLNLDDHFGNRVLPTMEGVVQVADTANGMGISCPARVDVDIGVDANTRRPALAGSGISSRYARYTRHFRRSSAGDAFGIGFGASVVSVQAIEYTFPINLVI
jgi:hypothetical protein